MRYRDELEQEGCVVRGPFQTYDHHAERACDAFEVMYVGTPPAEFTVPMEGTHYTQARLPESWGEQPPCCGDSHAYCEDPCDSGCVWESICLALIEEET